MKNTNGQSSQAKQSNQGEKLHKALFHFGEFIEVLKDPYIRTERMILSELMTVGYRCQLKKYPTDTTYQESAERLIEAFRELVNNIMDNGLDQVQFPIFEDGEYTPIRSQMDLHYDYSKLDYFLAHVLPDDLRAFARDFKIFHTNYSKIVTFLLHQIVSDESDYINFYIDPGTADCIDNLVQMFGILEDLPLNERREES
jgi:hypothetical protein